MPSADELFAAIDRGDNDGVRTLLAAQPDLAHSNNSHGVSPLMAATYSRKPAIVQVLLASAEHLSLFDAAAVGLRTSITEALGHEGADINGMSSDGWTALHLAAYFNHPDIVQMLIDQGASVDVVSSNDLKVTPLQSALSASSTASASILINAGASPGAAPGGNGWTAIHYAAANGLLQILNDLFTAGVDLNARTVDGKTPLALAEENSQTLVANDLRAHGATL